mgnify:CR=1 FL=1
MEEMLQIIKSELETWHYEFFEPSGYDDCLTSHNSSLIQDYLQDPNSDSVNEFWEDWDTSYDVEYVENELKKELSNKGYSDEEIEEFFEEEEDTIRDYILEYCEQSWPVLFKKYFEYSGDFTYTYYIGDMEKDTSIEDLICPKYDINSLDDIKEKIYEQDARALRYGLLLGFSIEELYKSYFSEDAKEHSTYENLKTIAVNDLGCSSVYFAFSRPSYEMINLREMLENWGIVSFTGWEWWTIDTSVGSGRMHSWLDFSDHEFVFNWWNLSIDEETWAYPYYSRVTGTSAASWYIGLIESSNWEKIPNKKNNLIVETRIYREQQERYRQTGCGGSSCNYFFLHTTTYNNNLAWYTCEKCGKFFPY